MKKYTLEEIKEAMKRAQTAIMKDKDLSKEPMGLATLTIGNLLFSVKLVEQLEKLK